MSKVEKLNKLVDGTASQPDGDAGTVSERKEVNISNVSELKSGDNVLFKTGHELAGSPGIVADMNVANQTVDVKVGGHVLRTEIAVGDLLLNN